MRPDFEVSAASEFAEHLVRFGDRERSLHRRPRRGEFAVPPKSFEKLPLRRYGGDGRRPRSSGGRFGRLRESSREESERREDDPPVYREEPPRAALQQHATVPVLYAASGNCHVFVDVSADLENAVDIIVNAKVQRPSVCNAAETLLVHADVAAAYLPHALSALRERGVTLRADDRARAAAGALGESLAPATESDFATEFLALELAVGVVDSVEDAIDHVNRYGSGHSEAILTADTAAAREFVDGVDAACVYVNASTRFTDGGEFGMGAEIGNSTQKLHARGPIGLRQLCTTKYVVEGTGQVRA